MDLQIIHVVLGKANPNRMNGVNKVVNSLATYQSKLGYDVSVWGITKTPKGSYPERNYKTILFADPSKFRLDKKIDQAIAELKGKVVFHIHGAFIPQFFLLAKKLVKHGIDYYYTPHGAYNTVALSRSNVKKKIYIELFEKYMVKNAAKVHFIGASEKTGAQSIFNEVKYVLVPNGQNVEELSFDFKSLNENSCPIFGFVGRLDIKTKGLDILLKGFAEFLEKSDGLGQLWLIGDGSERTKLEDLARLLQIDNHVKFFGSQFGEEKLNIMANMDFLCLTSRNEGLPGVVLEAAGLGIPAIVSNETNMGAYITNNTAGLCLENNTPANVSMALKKAVKWIRNGHIQQLKENATDMVKKQFNWTGISKRLIAVYEN